jgi:hypothetical protein
LPPDFKHPDILHVLARDTLKGKKEYLAIDGSLGDAAARAMERREGCDCINEVIKSSRRNIIFDIERDFTAAETAQVERARATTTALIMDRIHALFRELSGLPDLQLTLGVNCQLATSTYPHKYSCHFLIYADGVSYEANQAIAMELHRRCFAEQDPAILALLTWTDRNGRGRSVFDVTIYQSLRLLRMLYKRKLTPYEPDKRNPRMLPVAPSSKLAIAHMVTIDEASFARPAILPPLDLSSIPAPRMTISSKSTATNNGDARPPRPPTMPRWQPADLQVLLDLIEGHAELHDIFGPYGFCLGRVNVINDGASCIIPIERGPCCCYAGRVHRSNGMYLLYHHHDGKLSLRCHNAACKELPFHTWIVKAAQPDSPPGASPSLHSCEHLVPFQDYDEPEMRDLPASADTIAVLANMGLGKSLPLASRPSPERYMGWKLQMVDPPNLPIPFIIRRGDSLKLVTHAGKTEALKSMIRARREANPAYSVLITTFRRGLANKASSDFPGMLNYQDTKGPIDNDYAVVCLDSLPRVITNKPKDLFVADEAVSIALHANCPLIKDPSEVIQYLHYHLSTAKQIILLDACLDDVPTYQLIRCIERIRGVSASWIRNRHVRAPRSTANVHISHTPGRAAATAVRNGAIDKVIRLLRAGSRVFVTCTSKIDADIAYLSIARHFPVEDVAASMNTLVAGVAAYETLLADKTAAMMVDPPASQSAYCAGGAHSGAADASGDVELVETDSDDDCSDEAEVVHVPVDEPTEAARKLRGMCLTSETKAPTMQFITANVNATFLLCDFVVVSPAVTAGTSFTVEHHFTAHVGIMRNKGLEGPTVDAGIQQHHRVRPLHHADGRDGERHLWIHDPKDIKARAGPTDTDSIHRFIAVSLGMRGMGGGWGAP